MSEKTQNNFKKIDERTFEFALLIIELYRYLIANNEYVMSKQILRSGTSIGANVQEAQAAQSKKDFVSKMTIASKEARETDYWLRLLDKSGYLTDFVKKDEFLSENVAIINILTKIVKTSQQSSVE
ncbi:MAG: four helix bundle protein [Deltaproteobacteria bacterium]